MEQRALRLGDLVDDYCPRERRLTNHAVVAIVDDAIRQTRCTTCEAEHPYKDGKTPRRRKKDEKSDLYDQVLAGVTAGQLVTRNGTDAPLEAAGEPVEAAASTVSDAVPVDIVVAEIVVATRPSADAPTTVETVETTDQSSEPDDLWPAHRPLIRAQLPRVEGQQPQPQRPIHEFTMRQNGGRGQHSFRGGQGNGGGWSGGGNDGRGNQRGGGFRQGKPNGGGRPGQGGGRPNRPDGGRGKRSR